MTAAIVLQAARCNQRWYIHALTFVAAGVAPVLEEFFFRGLLHTYFRQALGDRKLAIVAGAAVFAAAHFGAWESMP